MELSLRVVASSLAVCLFITTVANEHITLKDESRMLRIIKWNVRNEKVWDVKTAIDNEFIFFKLHAFATISICSSGIEFSRTTRRWALLLSSDNNHLVLRISINFPPLSSSKDPVHETILIPGRKSLFEGWDSSVFFASVTNLPCEFERTILLSLATGCLSAN